MQTVLFLLFCVVSVWAVPARNGAQRIVGGEVTTIDQHPYMAAMLVYVSSANAYLQSCGGAILNERTILSAGHCYVSMREPLIPDPSIWRVRVGSSFSQSGGSVHNVAQIFNYPEYHPQQLDHDISVIHLASSIVFNANAQAAKIPAPNYILADNEPIWAVGWGINSWIGGVPSEQLKHVQLHVANQETCKQQNHMYVITDTMICFGADGPGKGTCQQDSGGPNIHRVGNDNVVVGVTAFGYRCGEANQYPDVAIRVTEYFDWILENAFTG
ncbi:trypsin domain-containing protein [Phthorimaea operculella]|nr:trypsin domain-containing protein [Phthorimaea operculella]